MCLETVHYRFKKPLEVSGHGYKKIKIVQSKGKKVALLYDGYYPLNKWITPKTQHLIIDNGLTYKSGFHIFKEISDAKKYFNFYSDKKTVKVRYKDITSIGRQDSSDNSETIVAQKMFIEYGRKTKKK